MQKWIFCRLLATIQFCIVLLQAKMHANGFFICFSLCILLSLYFYFFPYFCIFFHFRFTLNISFALHFFHIFSLCELFASFTCPSALIVVCRPYIHCIFVCNNGRALTFMPFLSLFLHFFFEFFFFLPYNITWPPACFDCNTRDLRCRKGQVHEDSFNVIVE